MRLRLDIAYDGTDFHGWAAQPDLRTVEGVLSDLLARITRQEIALTCAGRTDAGVHARGQVAHCDLHDVDADNVHRRLNRILPEDITVTACRPVSSQFDARFSALDRRYTYRMCDDRARLNPLRRRDVTLVPKPLDTDAMNSAAHYLLGEHDFAAFCKPRPGATTIRTLLELSSRREADVISTTVRADAFCHSMVRALMGALIAVGEGKFEPSWAQRILNGGVRDPRVKVMPARGLTMLGVTYPPEDRWAQQAEAARQRRDEVPR